MKYFAVWSEHSGYALDAYPYEIEEYRRDMINRGQNFEGPFNTYDQAIKVVKKRLREQGPPKTEALK